ncbi:acyl-CoA dehydrogenase [Comamonas serinivorans]|uniref:Acyl-CoA dehydrogenase n=1 Tax=Comamonas serinivorans TaxID=1082851 RepID=A0A1Y0ET46_9BURK|nr:acyl-CoA dehydrogenase family protein [Comamonas serinivorans]ARU06479.1 acyl-CoA dehydrogenase [Comamonas serinivorans]
MNFDFNEDSELLREQARKMLQAQCPTTLVRQYLPGDQGFDRALWQQMADLGWLGVTIAEEHGGSALGYEGLCVLAEEIGRALAPVPFASSVYLATPAIQAHASAEQQAQWLPKLASGQAIGCWVLATGLGNPREADVKLRVDAGKLNGEAWPVTDGAQADFAIVVARNAQDELGLYRVDLTQASVAREALQSIDPTRAQARLTFAGAAAEPLGAGRVSWADVKRLLAQAAVLVAFEQVGGASVCLETATAYAKERVAFGRPIGSFQAIKHKLADIYVANELARSNAYFGCWALANGPAELALAAATARVSATQAFNFAARENIQTHGGMGFTWEMDCHLFLRRSASLAALLGSAGYWKEEVVAEWTRASHAPAAAKVAAVAH